jgi:hypothetical protein
MIEDPDPDAYLCLMDPDPGGPKTYRSYGFGSATLVLNSKFISFLKIARL